MCNVQEHSPYQSLVSGGKKALLEPHLPRGRSFLKHEPSTAFQSYLNRGEEKLRNICQGHSPGIQNIMGSSLSPTPYHPTYRVSSSCSHGRQQLKKLKDQEFMKGVVLVEAK